MVTVVNYNSFLDTTLEIHKYAKIYQGLIILNVKFASIFNDYSNQNLYAFLQYYTLIFNNDD